MFYTKLFKGRTLKKLSYKDVRYLFIINLNYIFDKLTQSPYLVSLETAYLGGVVYNYILYAR